MLLGILFSNNLFHLILTEVNAGEQVADTYAWEVHNVSKVVFLDFNKVSKNGKLRHVWDGQDVNEESIFRECDSSVGTCSVTQAKLWTIFDGPSIVSEKSFQHVTLERNNTSSTVHMINRNIEGANNIRLRRSVKELRG
ncbi:hypothetical protein J1N35_015774 [Gossypium stocksii]|uniref:Uncharacterized protein n=1 Tax=Gossypium stocksii TaxID=47602 RepID=A0A9D4A8W5_9ROSI|nr:hypothetical protein J1N35_015774 [Gossypium stocksii]